MHVNLNLNLNVHVNLNLNLNVHVHVRVQGLPKSVIGHHNQMLMNHSAHRTIYRVIYGDTDNMGVAYHANYLRWFEIGRSEMFRSLGLPYKAVEERGIFLPVSQVSCKYISPAHYDDLLVIETSLDPKVRAGMKFDYRILREDGEKPLAEGHTKHACMDKDGRVVRPPQFLREIIDNVPRELERLLHFR